MPLTFQRVKRSVLFLCTYDFVAQISGKLSCSGLSWRYICYPGVTQVATSAYPQQARKALARGCGL